MKPNEEAFLRVLKKVGKKPEEFLFFDDNQECIEAARRLGMSAFCVADVNGVEFALERMELIKNKF